MHFSTYFGIIYYKNALNRKARGKHKPHSVSGMLLYAATDEAVQPDNDYIMSGNRISLKTLDLNKDFSDIKAQLDAIVADHFSKLKDTVKPALFGNTD